MHLSFVIFQLIFHEKIVVLLIAIGTHIRMFYTHHIMSIIAIRKASEKELCENIIKLTGQPEALDKEELKRVLHYGISNGFLVKNGNNYSLSSPQNVHHDDPVVEVDTPDNYNLYETDEAFVKATKPMVDRCFLDQLYTNIRNAVKTNDIAKVFSFRNEMQRIKKVLVPRNYNAVEYQSAVEKYKEFTDELRGFIDNRMLEVREILEDFRDSSVLVTNNDVAEFLINLSGLLLYRNFFDVARIHRNDSQIRLSDDDTSAWDEMSDAINSYFDTNYPNEEHFFDGSIFEWIHLREDGFVILFRDLAMRWCDDITESIKHASDAVVREKFVKFKTIAERTMENVKYIFHDLDDISDVIDEIETVVTLYLHLVNIKNNLLEKKKEILQYIGNGNRCEVNKKHKEVTTMVDAEMEFIDEKASDFEDILGRICWHIFDKINDDVTNFLYH